MAWRGRAKARRRVYASKARQGKAIRGQAWQGKAEHGMAWQGQKSVIKCTDGGENHPLVTGRPDADPGVHGAGWHDVARASAGRGDEGATQRARRDASRCLGRARATGGAARAALAYAARGRRRARRSALIRRLRLRRCCAQPEGGGERCGRVRGATAAAVAAGLLLPPCYALTAASACGTNGQQNHIAGQVHLRQQRAMNLTTPPLISPRATPLAQRCKPVCTRFLRLRATRMLRATRRRSAAATTFAVTFWTNTSRVRSRGSWSKWRACRPCTSRTAGCQAPSRRGSLTCRNCRRLP